MKNKNGFTLIELLAVIIILGIILIIALPVVSDIIIDSKKGAFKTSVQNIVSAVETKCQLDQIKSKNHNGIYTFTISGVTPNLNVKGELPTSGTIEVDDNCNVTSINISDGTFTAVLANNEIKINDGGTSPQILRMLMEQQYTLIQKQEINVMKLQQYQLQEQKQDV